VLGALDQARGLEHKVDEHRIEQPDPKQPSRADGMVALAESYLAGNVGTGNGGERFQVMLHVDQDPLAPDGALAGTLDDGTRGRVALGGFPPRAPTDPDMQISRIRLLKLRLRCGSVDAVDDPDRRQRIPPQQITESIPHHLCSC